MVYEGWIDPQKIKNPEDRIAELEDDLQKVGELSDKRRLKIKRLREALESISKNSCCGDCQEAKLVARKALEDE